MKILVVQLTRFGDILCTLPTLAALRRERPEAEIHFLVRKKFAGAAEGSPGVDHLWRLDSQKVLEPLIVASADGNGDVSTAICDSSTTLNIFVNELRAQRFDLIVNLSFSPSSSYLTHLISRSGIPVLGYTRTSDFYFHAPDLFSRYFHAQVGIDRSNRLHVMNLFKWIAGVALENGQSDVIFDSPSEKSGVVCHLGASQAQKAWPAHSWTSLIQQLSRLYKDKDKGSEKIILVGGPEDRDLAEKIRLQAAGEKVVNLAGRTTFAELREIVGGARLFIGADSGPMHVASLTGTPVLNLSLGNVRFWETGPVSLGSRILISEDPQLLGSDQVFQMAVEMLDGKNSNIGFVERVSEGKNSVYRVHPQASAKIDSWPLVEWIYFNGEKPKCGGEIQKALSQIGEVCAIAQTQLEVFYKNPNKVEVVGILDRLDEVLEMFRVNITPLAPLLDAFKTAKENIPPGPREEIFYQTKNCYTDLHRRAAQLAGLERDFHDGQVHKGAIDDPQSLA